MSCQIETITYPSWWLSATTVRVFIDPTLDSANHTYDRVDVELLPEGVSAPSVIWAWAHVLKVELVS